MRHPVVFAVILTLASACSACASLPRMDSPACQRASTATLADRHADPCGYADALAECANLPQRERDRIFARCRAEERALDAAGSQRGESLQGSEPCREE